MEELEFDPSEGGLRGTGRTTRLADAYIQELFTKGEITVEDHHIQGSFYLLYKIERRLESEHSHVVFTKKGLNLKLENDLPSNLSPIGRTKSNSRFSVRILK